MKIDQRNRAEWGSLALRIVLCAVFVLCGLAAFFSADEKEYLQERRYEIGEPAGYSAEESFSLADGAEQQFTAAGSRVTQLRLYIEELAPDAQGLRAAVYGSDGRLLGQKEIESTWLSDANWNYLAFQAEGMQRGEVCTLRVETLSPADRITGRTGVPSVPDAALGSCTVGGQPREGSVLQAVVQQVYLYRTPGTVLYQCMQLLTFLALTAAGVYTLWNAKSAVAALRQGPAAMDWVWAAVLSLGYLWMYNPADKRHSQMEVFRRAFGMGVIQNADPDRLIHGFLLWIAGFALLLALFLGFACLVRRRSRPETAEAWQFLDDLMALASACAIFKAVEFFWRDAIDVPWISVAWQLLCLLFLTQAAWLLLHLERRISHSAWQCLQIAVLSAALPAAVLLNQEWSQGMLLLGIQMIFALLLIPGVRLFAKERKPAGQDQRPLFCLTIAASLLPMMLSCYLELVNVANQYGIFLDHLHRWYAVLLVLLAGAAVVLYLALGRRRTSLPDARGIACPLLVAGFAMLRVQPALTAVYSADMFETANYSVLISDFLNFGKVPLVHHYGGHMMTDVWEGILYGLVNRDFAGAIFSPWSALSTVATALCFYWLLSHVWNREMAFWAALLLPAATGWDYYGMAVLLVLAVLAFVRKNTWFRAALVWLAAVWVVTYRLDTGAAFLVGALAALACWIIRDKNFRALRQLLITLAGYAAVFGGAWVLLCLADGISPLVRLREFIAASASNQNWSIGNLGDVSTMMYAALYMLLPLTVAGLLLYLVFSKKFAQALGTEKWMLLILFGGAYLANVQRTMVRHTSDIKNLGILLLTAPVFLAMFAAFKKNIRLFLPALAVFSLAFSLMADTSVAVPAPLLNDAAKRTGSMVETWAPTRLDRQDGRTTGMWTDIKQSGQVVQRVQWSEETQEKIQPLQKMADSLLMPHQTFVDMTNSTFAYSALNRRNPVYVSQSPMQVSGEFAQECFVQQISRDTANNPVVLLPADNAVPFGAAMLDNLPNPYRYYKISEYLYQNFVPLCRIGSYAIWYSKDQMSDLNSRGIMEMEEQLPGFASGAPLQLQECSAEYTPEGLTLKASGGDPGIHNFAEYLKYDPQAVTSLQFSVSVTADTEAVLELFYTGDAEGGFSTQQMQVCVLPAGGGTAQFSVPVEQAGKLRLDFASAEQITITSVKIGSGLEAIDYGYDLYLLPEENGRRMIDPESNSLHWYGLKQLPLLWAERDSKNAAAQPVQAELTRQGDFWLLDHPEAIDKTAGNYLLLNAGASGRNYRDETAADDELVPAVLRLGHYDGTAFTELCTYEFDLKEGQHPYLFRISADYLWYLNGINAVLLETDKPVDQVQMQILQGD